MSESTITTVGVVGAGTMGAGIAQLLASFGKKVFVLDISKEIAQSAVDKAGKNVARLVRKGEISEESAVAVTNRIIPTEDYEDFGQVDLVIEATNENMDLKKDVFSRIERSTEKNVIIATNTSTLSVTEIAMSTQRPQKVLGIHFFNPAQVMKLVEIIKTPTVSPEVIAVAKEFASSLGKQPVVVKDRAGFIVNRILLPMINEAIYVLDEGVASAAEIDSAMKLGANHPMGPLALADLIGLDVTLNVIEALYEELGDPKYRPAPLLRETVRAGHLGRKTGNGFFEYRKR